MHAIILTKFPSTAMLQVWSCSLCMVFATPLHCFYFSRVSISEIIASCSMSLVLNLT